METHLKKLVEFYSVTSKQENVKNLLEYVAGYLDACSMKVELVAYSGVHSLYAHPKGSKKSKILLQAHIDIVPGEGQPFRDVDGMYKGRGVYDMLYATACYLTLVDELKDAISDMDIGIMLTGDEEAGGFNGVGRMLDDGYTTDVCILPDAGNGYGALNVAAKGVYGPRITIHGASHHGSRPWEGDGAAIKAVHFLQELDEYFASFSSEDMTMTVAKIQGGDADNRGPATTQTVLDIRYRSKKELTLAKEKIHSLIKKYNGEITDVAEGEAYHLDTKDVYVQKFLQLYETRAKQPIEHGVAHGSSDARFFSAKNIPVIMLRPDGGGAHGDDEWISKESINKFYELLKDFTVEVATIGDRHE